MITGNIGLDVGEWQHTDDLQNVPFYPPPMLKNVTI